MDVIRLRIREARCRSADGRRFIPEGSLASVLSHEVIQHSLQTHCDVEPFAVQWMTRAVHQGGMKTFAVLILIRAENKIGTFLESYLQSDSQKLDSRLPFSKVDLEATLSLDFASEFQERQWELMAPVFTNRLLHRKIPVEYSLPFLESRRIGGGGFGDVYEVLVAAGHHNFHNVDSTQVQSAFDICLERCDLTCNSLLDWSEKNSAKVLGQATCGVKLDPTNIRSCLTCTI